MEIEEYEKKGDSLVQQANEENLPQDRKIDLLIKASIQYKIAKAYLKTANVLIIIGDLYNSQPYGEYQAASSYQKAGENFLLLNDYNNSKIYFDRAIILFGDNGKFASAAKVIVIVANLLIKQNLLSEAIIYCHKAHEFYLLEGSPATGFANLLKAGYLLLDLARYQEAIKCLGIVFNYYINNNLANIKCKELLLEIGIVNLCLQDVSGCKHWLDVCKGYKLHDAREYVYLNAFIDTYEKKDLITFNSLITEYTTLRLFHNSISKCLEQIKTTL